MYRATLIISALLLASLSPAAQAEWRCDCTTVVASCDASVEVKGNWVEINTDQQSCARVDYFIDGLPFVALAVGGSDRQDWIAQTDDPKVMVQSCQVCADKSTQPQPAASAVQRRSLWVLLFHVWLPPTEAVQSDRTTSLNIRARTDNGPDCLWGRDPDQSQ